MSAPVDVLDVLAVMDAEIVILKDRLSVYRRKADLIAAKKGERQITADRLRDRQEHRVERAVTARDAVAELMDVAAQVEAAIRKHAPHALLGDASLRAALARVGGAK